MDKAIRVLYLGPEGTHSHEATQQRFGTQALLIPCSSHFDLCERLLEDASAPLAVVPVENSSEGPVTQTLDMLAGHPQITIMEGFNMPVRHHLMVPDPATALERIKRIYSHPQALGQCRHKLHELLPAAELLSEPSTAAAALRCSREQGSAALASTSAAHLHRLHIIQRDLQDSSTNITRFFLISARAEAPPPVENAPAERRSLIYLVVGNRPGALLHVLSPFDAAGINLTFIQSRPLPGRPWEYGFFIEAITDWQSRAAEAVWQLVLALAESGHKLGTYNCTPWSERTT